ncbi:MAG: hypothetical protein EA423_02145 [Phycisphaerales bacterium]|nr:MAG: hypothetical protein EA423_02145 [Phycisphaerales bacterium]
MANERSKDQWILWLFVLCAALACAGCSSVRVTDPPRTATEQFMLSTAATEAVNGLSFENLRGRQVWLDDRYFAASESAFVLGQLRARLLLAGVRLVPDRDQCDVIVEVRSGGVGIDRYDSLAGLPPVFITSPIEGAAGAPLVTPELAIAKNQRQRGFASVAYVAYWRETGDVVAASGPSIGRSTRDDWWFFGLGPRTTGDIAPSDRDPR